MYAMASSSVPPARADGLEIGSAALIFPIDVFAPYDLV
jgi:hypothetical protein